MKDLIKFLPENRHVDYSETQFLEERLSLILLGRAIVKWKKLKTSEKNVINTPISKR
jgi:hypothetical protein